MPTNRTVLVLLGFLVIGLLHSVSPASAQLRRPRAELTPLVQPEAIHPGQAMSVGLRVELPETIHVQSDAPRDPYLIPTRLTLTLPEGLTLEEITYPEASDWLLEGQDEPLAVFENLFTVDVRLMLAPDVSPGEITLPGRFQYQACDDRICFPPVAEDVEWRVQVDAASNRE